MRSGANAGAPRAPRVSVLLVVRDAAHFVGEAVDSVLAQRFGDFELLIYDDGSTDDSSEVLERAAGRDLRVQLFREQPRGPTAWLRRGIEDARGELVACMDADDVAHPERFARQVEFLDRHRDCVAVGSDALLVDPLRRPLRRLGVRTQHEEIDAELMHGGYDAVLHPSVMMRRADVLGVGSYRTEYRASQCVDLFLRLAECGRLANLPKPLLEYRQHLCVVNSERKVEQQHTRDAILREAYARRGLAATALPVRPPLSEPLPMVDTWHRWATWAIDAGHLATGRRYAWQVFRREPFSRRSRRLGLRALLGTRLETARQLQRRLQGLVDSATLGRALDPERADPGPRNR